ncbi:hypothetical protein [Embleya sp. NPDC001921]
MPTTVRRTHLAIPARHHDHHTDSDNHEANLAEALDQLMCRARTEQHLLARGTPTRIPPPARSVREGREQDLCDSVPGKGEESLDELDDGLDESPPAGSDAGEDDPDSPTRRTQGTGSTTPTRRP